MFASTPTPASSLPRERLALSSKSSSRTMCPRPRRTQRKRIQTRRIWKICTEDDVMPGPDRDSIAEEAARLVCREALNDYRAAELKALDRSEENTSELQSLMSKPNTGFC